MPCLHEARFKQPLITLQTDVYNYDKNLCSTLQTFNQLYKQSISKVYDVSEEIGIIC